MIDIEGTAQTRPWKSCRIPEVCITHDKWSLPKMPVPPNHPLSSLKGFSVVKHPATVLPQVLTSGKAGGLGSLQARSCGKGRWTWHQWHLLGSFGWLTLELRKCGKPKTKDDFCNQNTSKYCTILYHLGNGEMVKYWNSPAFNYLDAPSRSPDPTSQSRSCEHRPFMFFEKRAGDAGGDIDDSVVDPSMSYTSSRNQSDGWSSLDHLPVFRRFSNTQTYKKKYVNMNRN